VQVLRARVHRPISPPVAVGTADEVIVKGCSAGGLGLFLQADHIRELVPPRVRLAAVVDAGLFVPALAVSGEYSSLQWPEFQGVARCRGVSAVECLDPTRMGIRMPLMVLNSMYDNWQLFNYLGVECAKRPSACTHGELSKMHSLADAMREKLELFGPEVGVFALSCPNVHGEAGRDKVWSAAEVGGMTMHDAVAAWYKGEQVRKLDCPYPCNESCPKEDSPLSGAWWEKGNKGRKRDWKGKQEP